MHNMTSPAGASSIRRPCGGEASARRRSHADSSGISPLPRPRPAGTGRALAGLVTPASDLGYLLRTRGWVLLDRVVPPGRCLALAEELRIAADRCAAVRRARGLDDVARGTAHHLVGEGRELDMFLEDLPAMDLVADRLGAGFVLNSYGGVINRPGERAYVHAPHRDVRIFTRDVPLLVNMLVMLGDFTLDNGATMVLSGSHEVDEPPERAAFERWADRLVGKAGSVVVFDSCLWHAAGPNTSPRDRLALTLTFSRPFVKPQLDYLRKLGDERVVALPPRTRTLLGYRARVPSTLDEWYRPRAERFYRPDAE